MISKRLDHHYFQDHDAIFVARDILGKTLVRQFDDGSQIRGIITEAEAYQGMDDLACHGSSGETPRNKLLFGDGGVAYVYLIYGMYWLLNFVTGKAGIPQGVLIRGLDICNGPGRIGRLLKLDKSFYGEDLEHSTRLWVEDGKPNGEIIAKPRVGIDYSGEASKNLPWRFILREKK